MDAGVMFISVIAVCMTVVAVAAIIANVVKARTHAALVRDGYEEVLIEGTLEYGRVCSNGDKLYPLERGRTMLHSYLSILWNLCQTKSITLKRSRRKKSSYRKLY